MFNSINEDQVYIQIAGVGEWIECSVLSTHDWCVYEAFAETTGDEVNTNRDFLVTDTDDESGIMHHFFSGEIQSFDFAKYGELYDWLENTQVSCGAVDAYMSNHSSEYITKEKFEQEYIGEFKTVKEFLQNHLSDEFEGINQYWLDWQAVWDSFKCDYFEINDFYFHNY